MSLSSCLRFLYLAPSTRCFPQNLRFSNLCPFLQIILGHWFRCYCVDWIGRLQRRSCWIAPNFPSQQDQQSSLEMYSVLRLAAMPAVSGPFMRRLCVVEDHVVCCAGRSGRTHKFDYQNNGIPQHRSNNTAKASTTSTPKVSL